MSIQIHNAKDNSKDLESLIKGSEISNCYLQDGNYKSDLGTNISIDSLKVRIPFSSVQVVNSVFNEARYTVDSQGDIIEEFKNNAFSVNLKGVKTKYLIQKQGSRGQLTINYLLILFNSKLLGKDYLEGLTLGNIRKVYDQIISQGVVKFSYDDFLWAKCTDVDYKMDSVVQSYREVFSHMNSNAKRYVQRDRGCDKTNKSTNAGIEFGTRKKATPSYPYLKLYAKALELQYNSDEFKKAYQISVDPNTVRVEFTIKDKSHFRKYGIEDTRLKNALSLSQDKLSSILKSIISIHLEKRIMTKSKVDHRLTANKTIQRSALMYLLKQGLSIDIAIENLIVDINGSSPRSKKRKELRELYDGYIKDTTIAKTSVKMNGFFELLGWS